MSKFVSLQAQHLARCHFLGGKSNQLLSWKLRFVSWLERYGHKQIAASILLKTSMDENGWWRVTPSRQYGLRPSTENHKTKINFNQPNPPIPPNSTHLPFLHFPSPSLPPQKQPNFYFHVLQKKSQDSTKMEVAKDAFKTCCTGAICSGKPAATPMVQPLERTPPGTEAWIWKRYSESVNKSSNLGGNFWGFGGLGGVGTWWLGGWWVGGFGLGPLLGGWLGGGLVVWGLVG